MDSLVTAAARALRVGDPLGALKRIALRDDPPALALRGVAMAQLGELGKARLLLRRAARGFGPRERLARARCLAAEAEVALAARDLGWPGRALEQALRTFDAVGDRSNRLHVHLLQVRRLLLLGRVDAAEQALAGLGHELDPAVAPAPLRAGAALLAFEVAVRRGRTAPAREAIGRAREAAGQAGITALQAEIERAGRALELPAARLLAGGQPRSLTLAQVESLLASARLVVDACRRVVRAGSRTLALARRPVLFALLRSLAEAWPSGAGRERLLDQAFGVRRPNESHRARLRVELGRLRALLRGMADVQATRDGFVLVPRVSEDVVLLAPPIETPNGALLALLADGEAWSTSALALALGASQRSVQRALGALADAGEVRAAGHGRARRWLSSPVTEFTTTLLLPTPLALG